MKIASVASFCFIGAVVLGLVVGWRAVVPAQANGEQLRGSCTPCIGTHWVTCPKKNAGQICTKTALRCTYYLSGKGECYSTTWSPCVPDLACVSLVHQSCIGE